MPEDPQFGRLDERVKNHDRRIEKLEDGYAVFLDALRAEIAATERRVLKQIETVEERLKGHTEKTVNGKIADVHARYYLVRVVVFGLIAIILTAFGGWLVRQWVGEPPLGSPGSLYRRGSGPEY